MVSDRCWCSESEVLRFVKNKKTEIPAPTKRCKSNQDVVIGAKPVKKAAPAKLSDEVSVEPQPLKHVDSLTLLAKKKLRKPEEECEANVSTKATASDTSSLDLRSWFSHAEHPTASSECNSKLRGLFSTDSVASRPSSTVSFDPRVLFGGAEGASKKSSGTRTTTDVPSLIEASAQTSWSEAKTSLSELHHVVTQLREAGALLQKTVEMVAHGGPKSERPVAPTAKLSFTDLPALRVAAIEAADAQELLTSLGRVGSVSGYVKLLEVIADDYVRLTKLVGRHNHSLV